MFKCNYKMKLIFVVHKPISFLINTIAFEVPEVEKPFRGVIGVPRSTFPYDQTV